MKGVLYLSVRYWDVLLTAVSQDKSACKGLIVTHRNLSTVNLSVGVRVWSSSEQGSILGTESTVCSRELEKWVQVGLLSHMWFLFHNLLSWHLSHGPDYMCKTLSVFDCRFAPSLKVLCYEGDKARRAELQADIESQQFDVLLTTYEVSGLRNKRV